jgi:uncharacterized protein
MTARFAEDPVALVTHLVQSVAAGNFVHLHELYAEVTNVTHPLDPTGSLAICSQDQLREHFTVPEGMVFPKRRVINLVVHRTVDPEVVIAEFAYEWADHAEVPVRVPCVFVVRVREGQIVESRDYIDPIRSAQARNNVNQLIANLQAMGQTR